MDPDPVTIYHSFDEAVYQPHGIDPFPHAHISGETTAMCEPPRFLLKVRFEKWELYANDVLKSHKSFLKNRYLPTTEENALFETEGDVVAGATLELNHPVHVALVRDTPTTVHGSEVSMPLPGRVSSSSTSRADKVCFRYLQDRPPESFAVLDYKKVSVIQAEEFDHGIAMSESDFIRWSNTGENRFNENANATILLKQSVHYSWVFDTPFVALFDMRTLILLVFPGRERGNGGEYAYITIVEEPTLMRKAFLGFLKLAALHKDMYPDQWLGAIQSQTHLNWIGSLNHTATRQSSRISSRYGSRAEGGYAERPGFSYRETTRQRPSEARRDDRRYDSRQSKGAYY